MRLLISLFAIFIISLLCMNNAFAGGCLNGDSSKTKCVEMPKGAFSLEKEKAMCSKSGSTYVEVCKPPQAYCLMDNGPSGKIYLWGNKVRKAGCRGTWHE